MLQFIRCSFHLKEEQVSMTEKKIQPVENKEPATFQSARLSWIDIEIFLRDACQLVTGAAFFYFFCRTAASARLEFHRLALLRLNRKFYGSLFRKKWTEIYSWKFEGHKVWDKWYWNTFCIIKPSGNKFTGVLAVSIFLQTCCFFVAAPRTSLAGMQCTVTALPCTVIRQKCLIHSYLLKFVIYY